MRPHPLCIPALLLLLPGLARAEEPDRYEAFRRAATLGLEPVLIHVFADEERLAEIDRLGEDEVLRLDLDGDGRIDALAWKEGTTRVVGIDRDGDLGPTDMRPDRDSDAYVADLNSNGIPDRLVVYRDFDGDGRMDRQDLYEITRGPLGLPGVGAIVALDLDGDGRLFQTTDYTYHANRDQWGSDFDGDGFFVAAARDEETGRWRSLYENPFCFFDLDGSGFSDEALRLAGEDLRIDSIRWSFDVDGDAPLHGRPDYDCSLTAIGPVYAPGAIADSLVMQDGGIVRFVSRSHVREFARWAPWRSILFVWDEEDHNTAPVSATPDRERWEGVIPEGWRGFPAIGGPPHDRANKRYELDADGSGRMRLYWSGIDGRIHLAGAEIGETLVRLRGEGSLERRISSFDEDRNGFFETWEWHAGGGPDMVRRVRLPDEAVRMLPTRLDSLRSFWKRALPEARARTREEIGQLARAIDFREPLPVDRWWRAARERNDPLAARAERSLEAERLLLDLRLLEMGGGFLARSTERAEPAAIAPLPLDRDRDPGCLIEQAIDRLPASARKALFPQAIVEVAFDSIRIAAQIEDGDGDGIVDRIYCPGAPDLRPAPAAIVIQPPRPLRFRESVRVDPWFAGGIAFESEPIGCSIDRGRLDLLLKRRPRLVLRTDAGSPDRPAIWGMDPLHVGSGPGLGGLFAWSDDRWIPLFGGEAATDAEILVGGPLRGIVRVGTGAAGISVVRTFSLEAGAEVVLEELILSGGEALPLAAAVAALETSGRLEGFPGIWSFGLSVPDAGPVGLAGARIDGGAAEPIEIEGAVALRFTARPGVPIGLAWAGGGAISGTGDAPAWASRAAALLGEARERSARCGGGADRP